LGLIASYSLLSLLVGFLLLAVVAKLLSEPRVAGYALGAAGVALVLLFVLTLAA
jgi:hypothetical protein